MNINGTYLDRLLWNVLPITFLVGLIIYLIEGKFEFVVLVGITILFWLMDTLIIYFKFRPSRLRHSATNDLFLNNKKINTNEIFIITPICDQRMKWSFKMINLTLTNGETITIIDKPQTFIEDIMNKQSKSLKILFEKYPDLKSKLTSEKNI